VAEEIPPAPKSGPPDDIAHIYGKGSAMGSPDISRAYGEVKVGGNAGQEPHCLARPDAGPEMVLIAAGMFVQGSSDKDADKFNNELPEHTVEIKHNFAISRCEVTVAEFRRFVDASHYRTDAERGKGCYVYDPESKTGREKSGVYWRKPGFEQTGNDPVVCVSWNDAQAYLKWLNADLKLPEKTYRLPSESEWEYAARAGTQTPYYLGAASQCEFANGADQTLKSNNFSNKNWTFADCEDKYAFTAPVGSFKANSYGLYDMSGNAWEWVEDCWHENYTNAPDDGNVWLEADNGDCGKRSIRGGSWNSLPRNLRSANRVRDTPDEASYNSGFRLARTI
jgi:formylglycine-generating enzyme required for sulfatase activity